MQIHKTEGRWKHLHLDASVLRKSLDVALLDHGNCHRHFPLTYRTGVMVLMCCTTCGLAVDMCGCTWMVMGHLETAIAVDVPQGCETFFRYRTSV